jgi:hypothetical protein
MQTTHPTRRAIFLTPALTLCFCLAPIAAAAEERDPGEIGHALFILSMIAILFFGSMAFGIWLIIARLRSDAKAAQSGERLSRTPNLESIWFPSRQRLPPSHPEKE